MSSVIQVTSVSYPESDGKPMGETDQHRKEMIREMELLERFFQGQQVYVSGDLLVYYERGNPKKFVVPDVFVVLGLEPGDRRIYKLWVEQSPERGYRSHVAEDEEEGHRRQAGLVRETGNWRVFPVRSHRGLPAPAVAGKPVGGRRVRVHCVRRAGALISRELGLRLQPQGGQLMFYRLDTGERLLTAEEARRAAEAEVARLREELRRAAPPPIMTCGSGFL